MKILVVGAGALGGYFGGRLAAAGRDVTFLVRPRRAKQLAETGGLVIVSPVGDYTLADPKLASADELKERYDIVLLACKATALDSCMRDMAPAVGPRTMIIPVLNGMRHIGALAERFGRERILGGRAFIFAMLDEAGRVIHQAQTAILDYGELDGGESVRAAEADKVLSGAAGFEGRLRSDIQQDLWEKWVMISTTAGSTAMFRAAFGDIVKAGGLGFMQALLAECVEIATLNGHKPGDQLVANIGKTIADASSPQMASLAKDMDKSLPIEADQIIGDFIERIPEARREAFPCLKTVYIALKAYEARKERER